MRGVVERVVDLLVWLAVVVIVAVVGVVISLILHALLCDLWDAIRSGGGTMNEEKTLVCPYCDEVMVEGRIKMADGTWQDVLLCGCVGEDEETVVVS